eukprot:360056-Chlamydomonas_euryale.AAC.18
MWEVEGWVGCGGCQVTNGGLGGVWRLPGDKRRVVWDADVVGATQPVPSPQRTAQAAQRKRVPKATAGRGCGAGDAPAIGEDEQRRQHHIDHVGSDRRRQRGARVLHGVWGVKGADTRMRRRCAAVVAVVSCAGCGA